MTRAPLRTIEEIFRGALDQEPEAIGAFLDTACEGNELLRRKVEALMASRQKAGSFIKRLPLVWQRGLLKKGKLTCSSVRRSATTKFPNGSAAGGMGEVYLATDMTAGREVALKLLPMRFTGEAERLKRFQREARAVVGLNHPNIVTVYEVGEQQSTHYIASELIEGETLRARLLRGPIQFE